eukprot:8853858-Pyramimonas_sp.AAC.1
MQLLSSWSSSSSPSMIWSSLPSPPLPLSSSLVLLFLLLESLVLPAPSALFRLSAQLRALRGPCRARRGDHGRFVVRLTGRGDRRCDNL